MEMALHKERLPGLVFAAGPLLIFGLSVLVWRAQSDRGTITGTVTDPDEQIYLKSLQKRNPTLWAEIQLLPPRKKKVA